MNRINDEKERLIIEEQAATFNTIHEMLGSGKWTMDFDEAGVMVRVNWSDEFRRMFGYHGTDDFPDVLDYTAGRQRHVCCGSNCTIQWKVHTAFYYQ